MPLRRPPATRRGNLRANPEREGGGGPAQFRNQRGSPIAARVLPLHPLPYGRGSPGEEEARGFRGPLRSVGGHFSIFLIASAAALRTAGRGSSAAISLSCGRASFASGPMAASVSTAF